MEPPAKWEVLWIHRGKLVRADQGDDFAKALSLYTKAVKAGKTAATLRCKNKGVAPPVELRPHTKVMRKKGTKGVRPQDRVSVTVTPMKEHNLHGILWCPYCVGLRPFKLRRGFPIGGVYVKEKRYHCVMCGVSHRDFHVQRWNPVARRMAYDLAPRTRSGGK